MTAASVRRIAIASEDVPAAARAGERVFLSAANAVQSDGTVCGLGDAAAQTHAALDQLEEALEAAGGSLRNIAKLTTSIVDRGYRTAVYAAIAARLKDVRPVSTGLVVAGLPRPELIVQIDAEAAIASAPARRIRPYTFDSWHGQGFPWQGAMVIATDEELFVRGQTGARLDHSGTIGLGRTVEDAGAQADLALENLATLLKEAGSSLDEVCKLTVYISDRAYRSAVYPMIGKHLRDVRPVSTGIVTSAFARPEVLFELDVQVLRKREGRPHERLRPYHSSAARYGHYGQKLDCEFCMAVKAGRRVILRGQTGVGLDEVMRGTGDAAAQAEQAMDNVAALLADAGAAMRDVVKATVYVTDRAFLDPVSAVVLRRLAGVGPAFTAVIVKGLASPELLMEVDIIAVLPEERR
ncbi:MAG TPA: Rid family hydrolase [Beijerinckiaceae bacterium]|nr:Rid family hydrolase [Beijerinckiaceae bacterium]